MDIKLIKMALERLHDEVEALKQKNVELEQAIQELKKDKQPAETPLVVQKSEDELMDTKQVLKYLGVCYNTLQSIIKDGFINPIRINQRRIRFSKKSLQAYIQRLQTKPA